MLETIVVTVIVSLAALQIGRRYVPATWRRWLGGARRSGNVDARSRADACGACTGCDSGPKSRREPEKSAPTR